MLKSQEEKKNSPVPEREPASQQKGQPSKARKKQDLEQLQGERLGTRRALCLDNQERFRKKLRACWRSWSYRKRSGSRRLKRGDRIFCMQCMKASKQGTSRNSEADKNRQGKPKRSSWRTVIGRRVKMKLTWFDGDPAKRLSGSLSSTSPVFEIYPKIINHFAPMAVWMISLGN